MTDAPTRPRRSPVGTPHVLVALKRYAKIPLGPAEEAATITPVASDGFPVADDSPLRREHEWLGTLFGLPASVRGATESDLVYKHAELLRQFLDRAEHKLVAAFKKTIAEDPPAGGRLILAMAEREVNNLIGLDSSAIPPCLCPLGSYIHDPLMSLLDASEEWKPEMLDRAGLFDLELFLLSQNFAGNLSDSWWTGNQILERLGAPDQAASITEGERYILSVMRENCVDQLPFGAPEDLTDRRRRLTAILGDGLEFFLNAFSAWTDGINRDLSRLDPAAQAAWVDLLKHAATATGSKPSGKWLATGRSLIAAVDPAGESVRAAFGRWLPLYAEGWTIDELPLSREGRPENLANSHWLRPTRDAFRGLLWLVPALPRPDDLAEAVAGVALAAFEKVPGIGPRSLKVATAAVATLGAIPSRSAIEQLARLRREVKHKPAHAKIDAALADAGAG